MNRNKVELLAPAGGMSQLKAAVENGADAIYIGGKKFNARMNAGNFSISEMEQALRYAHTRDVKIFVTLNILIKDEELMEAVEYIAKLYEIGIDAVILQDIGLAALAKKYVPDMELHFSTQGTVYNRSGVENALKLGFDRVVLAREMSIEEIKNTTDLCDIEVFIHGAMCMCYSGQCQMSRMMGGRSGNRGSCAQPCRLPYVDDKGKKSHILSPKDMCTIDLLGDLIDAGVMSLKIEGRMKSPEYVATVVRIYRKYIDLYYKNGSYVVSEQDRTELEQIYNRGGFTTGYMEKNPKDEILSGNLPKHQGIYAGTVVKNCQHDLVQIKLAPHVTLENGDAVEIRSKELMGNLVTYIKEVKDNDSKKSKGKNEGAQLIIGDIKGNPAPGDKVYKTRSKALMDKAENSSKEYTRKKEIGAVFTGIAGEYPTLCLYTEDTEVNVTGTTLVEKAINRPLDQGRIEEQLQKTGSTPFQISYICCTFPENCTMPIKEINQMRRIAIDQLTDKLVGTRKKIDLAPLHQLSSMDDIVFSSWQAINQLGDAMPSPNELDAMPSPNELDAMPSPIITREMAMSWLDEKIIDEKSYLKNKILTDQGKEIIVFSNVTKGAEDQAIKKLLKEDLTDKIIILNNIGWLDEFKKAGAKVYVGPGLNVSNQVSEKLLNSMGVEVAGWSLETEETAELLMITEHPINSKYIKDRKGKTYRIQQSPYGDKFYITNK